jgi:hypothetical protein
VSFGCGKPPTPRTTNKVPIGHRFFARLTRAACCAIIPESGDVTLEAKIGGDCSSIVVVDVGFAAGVAEELFQREAYVFFSK